VRPHHHHRIPDLDDMRDDAVFAGPNGILVHDLVWEEEVRNIEAPVGGEML
jgi:hypothetical protein